MLRLNLLVLHKYKKIYFTLADIFDKEEFTEILLLVELDVFERSAAVTFDLCITLLTKG